MLSKELPKIPVLPTETVFSPKEVFDIYIYIYIYIYVDFFKKSKY